MTLKDFGNSTSAAEILNISKHGIWLHVQGKEYLLPYDKFPWFKGAKVEEILDVQLLHGHHLHWPKLDVDLELESLEHPERFPLVYG